MTDIAKQTDMFWDRVDDINAGMLGLSADARLVPMSHYAKREDGALWFITAKETELARSVAAGAEPAIHIVTDGGEGLYARIHGQLSLSTDAAKLDELWNIVADSWFDEGKRDTDAVLLRLDLTEAEVWATGGKLSFLYQIAKAQITGDTPDMGDHFTLRF